MVPGPWFEMPSDWSDNETFCRVPGAQKYVEGKCENLGIPFADMLCLGVPTPRELSDQAQDGPEVLEAPPASAAPPEPVAQPAALADEMAAEDSEDDGETLDAIRARVQPDLFADP